MWLNLRGLFSYFQGTVVLCFCLVDLDFDYIIEALSIAEVVVDGQAPVTRHTSSVALLLHITQSVLKHRGVGLEPIAKMVNDCPSIIFKYFIYIFVLGIKLFEGLQKLFF